jgi:hypothetical protein
MRLLAVLASVFVLGGQSYPSPYPRAGTTSSIDNARVQVWDVSWPKGQPSGLHRQLKGITHIEEGTSDPLRAVMIELKGDGK